MSKATDILAREAVDRLDELETKLTRLQTSIHQLNGELAWEKAKVERLIEELITCPSTKTRQACIDKGNDPENMDAIDCRGCWQAWLTQQTSKEAE